MIIDSGLLFWATLYTMHPSRVSDGRIKCLC